jgi:hypothetical protein
MYTDTPGSAMPKGGEVYVDKGAKVAVPFEG